MNWIGLDVVYRMSKPIQFEVIKMKRVKIHNKNIEVSGDNVSIKYKEKNRIRIKNSDLVEIGSTDEGDTVSIKKSTINISDSDGISIGNID